MAMQSYDHKIERTQDMNIFELAARAISARATFGLYDQDNQPESWKHMEQVDRHYGYSAHCRLCGMRFTEFVEAGEPDDYYPNYGTVYDGWRK